MNNIDIVKEFEKLEQKIVENTENNRDVTGLLRAKARLLKICYAQLTEAISSGKTQKIAPLFAQELAFLNNIKDIHKQINEDYSEIESEIAKIHAQMYEAGFGWILENLPEKQAK